VWPTNKKGFHADVLWNLDEEFGHLLQCSANNPQRYQMFPNHAFGSSLVPPRWHKSLGPASGRRTHFEIRVLDWVKVTFYLTYFGPASL
jgi:hypothetical protein